MKHIDYCANSLLEFLDQEHIDLALKRQMESIDRDIRANIEEFLFVSNAEEILDKYGMFMFEPDFNHVSKYLGPRRTLSE